MSFNRRAYKEPWDDYDESKCIMCNETKTKEEQDIGRDLCWSCYLDTEGRE